MTIDRTSDRRVAPGDGDRREQILAAAARAIGRHGIENVRTLDVAREAGVSIGALQHHFYNRDPRIGEAVRPVPIEAPGSGMLRLGGLAAAMPLRSASP